MNTAEKVADQYVILQQEIFGMLIDAIKGVRPRLTELKAEEMVEWRIKALAQMDALTQQVIDYIKKQSPAIAKAIDSVIKRDGLKVSQSFNRDLAKLLNQPIKPVSTETMQVLDSYAAQTWRSLDNNVNQSLLSTNVGKNPALRVYQDILNKSTLAVTTGLKTPQEAIFNNIDDWVKTGLPTTLIDKGGHKWSLEGYTRTVITTTTLRTYNDVRMQSLKDYNQTLAIMTSHPAARPACAPIQGKVVNVIDHGDPRFNPKYPTIYDYGYGTPAGTLGINCMHELYPYVEGVTINRQKHYDEQEAIRNGEIQQMQRYYERQVRKWKQRKLAAERIGNTNLEAKCSSAIRGYQSKIRKIVSENDFLTRQYDREKIANI
ncbi:phage minor capsid protein [Lactobacillus delbrueckii subsp. bulgaricus]|uniref:phage minor capsid protein n=1 Tax=Lactobacillus delbrueckii TaxID=1584 RepID=UPI00054D2BB2|nr:phage minor capsid protein [Lactobacillus delbrueckii]MCD5464865.1 phage minor capsid protein [Lactobacillus delbrueckii subsp. bulgaricus]MCD5482399.1 phage minor capsid protein [Lactobacillus delbrueckii subsp. bulgaricus]MCD5482451.1 phage minor capsid protein [Lactobacillus delbrueckii subsp. bulgaricus]MCT3468530.1 minor capsid protein [Lactobacillus delbrueckii subsp. bulgaricus]